MIGPSGTDEFDVATATGAGVPVLALGGCGVPGAGVATVEDEVPTGVGMVAVGSGAAAGAGVTGAGDGSAKGASVGDVTAELVSISTPAISLM